MIFSDRAFIASFSERLLAWFDQHGRKDLPWQQDANPYHTWISEVMLQQTQVATVIPYFQKFIAHFPDTISLANADLDEVLALWAGLGYYSRARNLHKAARQIRDQHQGQFPQQYDAVLALPGIGKSTAGAILSLSLNQHHAILDGNVKRVLSRHQRIDGLPNRSATLKQQWAIAEALTPPKHCQSYNQAMMDLGAMICTRSRPKCSTCPVRTDCGALQHQQIDSYPNKQPKKTLPEKQTTMLIITDGDRVYLEKRPETGIWGGLWSLPEVEPENIKAFATTQGLRVHRQYPQAHYQHVFTHYRLHITTIVLEVDAVECGFDAASRRRMGLPAPVTRLLEKYSCT